MKTTGKFLLLLLLVAVVASLSCFATGRYMRSEAASQHKDFHHWLHQQLDLTAEQNKALDAEEEKFAATRKQLGDELQQANAELAQAIMQDREYSPKVQEAIEKIHHAQSDLEKTTLEHIFAMKPILTPEQFEKVLHLTGETLNSPPQP